MVLLTLDESACNEVEQRTGHHEKDVDGFAPSVENEGTNDKHKVFEEVAMARNFGVYAGYRWLGLAAIAIEATCHCIAEKEDGEENEEKKQVGENHLFTLWAIEN